MKKMIGTGLCMLTYLASIAQVTVSSDWKHDPNFHKVIPDKVFEFGVPLLFLLLLQNTILSILKTRAETKIKIKMLEKNVSEETMIKIFKESNAIAKLQPLKWFLFTTAMAIPVLIIHLYRDYLIGQSGYLAVGLFLLFLSAAFLIYYNILSKRI